MEETVTKSEYVKEMKHKDGNLCICRCHRETSSCNDSSTICAARLHCASDYPERALHELFRITSDMGPDDKDVI
jgi:hypothetical protein